MPIRLLCLLAAALTALPATAEPAATAPTATPAAIYEAAAPAVVRVFTPGGRGSGFLFRDRRVATAWHVVRGARQIQVESLDGGLLDATVISFSKESDLAVLELVDPLTVQGEPVVPLPLAAETPAVGTPILAIGHPNAPARSSSARRRGSCSGRCPRVWWDR